MKIIQKPYTLCQCGMDQRDWRFEESDDILAATEEFDHILEHHRGRAYVQALARFLKAHPNHIDALHHYSTCKLHADKDLEALGLSHTAVATGIRAFPKEFVVGRDRLDTGYVSNRPFLRACHGLMLAQHAVGLVDEAIDTGRMCLGFDPGDRNGARIELPRYFLEQGRDHLALELFEKPAYKETFHDLEYLHALALIRLGRTAEARKTLESCLHYQPLVAKYLLDSSLPEPPNEDRFGGVVWGSELEGWIHALQHGHLWRTNREAMEILRKESEPHSRNSWKRLSSGPGGRQQPAGPSMPAGDVQGG